MLPAPRPSEVQFTDVTARWASTSRTQNSATSSKYLIETMGGGVALLDYDNDGRLDVFFTNGARIDDPMPDGGAPDKSRPRNTGIASIIRTADGTLQRVTEKAGLTGHAAEPLRHGRRRRATTTTTALPTST